LGGSGTRDRNLLLFLDVAKWPKAPDCNSGGASPRRFAQRIALDAARPRAVRPRRSRAIRPSSPSASCAEGWP